MQPDRTLAVALHDIEPATFERAALIRDWLDDLGVDRVTLLVIPARDMHPLSDRRPEVGTWLLERAGRGDAIAQHGFHHLQARRPRWPPHPRCAIARESPEFVGLDQLQTARAVDAGRRILKLAGIEPRLARTHPLGHTQGASKAGCLLRPRTLPDGIRDPPFRVQRSWTTH
jgi:predicted deacetylase